MFIDASALVAIFNREDGYAELERRILELESPYVSPMVKFEASLAVSRSTWARTKGAGRSRAELIVEARVYFEKYLAEIGARELPITGEIGNAALDAAAAYGKVVGHKAALNMGDCFSYACAEAQNVPLLYKGNDFVHTDLA
jgi:ribonuclease VapC